MRFVMNPTEWGMVPVIKLLGISNTATLLHSKNDASLMVPVSRLLPISLPPTGIGCHATACQ